MSTKDMMYHKYWFVYICDTKADVTHLYWQTANTIIMKFLLKCLEKAFC